MTTFFFCKEEATDLMNSHPHSSIAKRMYDFLEMSRSERYDLSGSSEGAAGGPAANATVSRVGKKKRAVAQKPAPLPGGTTGRDPSGSGSGSAAWLLSAAGSASKNLGGAVSITNGITGLLSSAKGSDTASGGIGIGIGGKRGAVVGEHVQECVRKLLPRIEASDPALTRVDLSYMEMADADAVALAQVRTCVVHKRGAQTWRTNVACGRRCEARVYESEDEIRC